MSYSKSLHPSIFNYPTFISKALKLFVKNSTFVTKQVKEHNL